MVYTKKAGDEPLAGYRLIEPLGQGGFGEVWKCEVPGGLFKAIKFVYGRLNGLDPDRTAQRELEALERVKSIRHPFVLSLERVEILQGELVIIMELADKNLEDLLNECQATGMAGIPRDDLLPMLADAAEALDLLNHEHGLQHLDIKPSNLFLVGNHVKVGDFGLLQSLQELTAGEEGQSQFGMTPLYSPPEMLQGNASLHCDQYSLAIVYQQLLTGKLPFDGKNARQLMMKHLAEPPNLEPLSEKDRPLVGKALAKNPDERFSGCQEFIQALIWSEGPALPSATARPRRSGKLLRRVASEPPARSSTQDGNNSAADAETPVKEHLSLRALRETPTQESNALSTTPTGRKTPTVRNSFSPGNAASSENAETMPGPGIEIPGYEFSKCLQTSVLGDLWQIQSSDGQKLLARLLSKEELLGDKLRQFEAAMRQLEHPSLAQQELVEHEGRLILLTEYNSLTLYDYYRASVTEERPGISREQLLPIMGWTARALDELAERFDMPHLFLHPHALLLEKGQVLLVEMGLVAFLWDRLEKPPVRLNTRYAAPEVLAGEVAATSDQYSLALIYTEMLTGFHPRPKRLAGKMRNLQIDLTFVPSCDKGAVQRALNPNPAKRFPSCCEFLRALGVRFGTSSVMRTIPKPKKLAPLLPMSQLHGQTGTATAVLPGAGEYFRDFVSRTTSERIVRAVGDYAYAQLANQTLESQVPIRLPEAHLRGALEDFAQKWQASIESSTKNAFLLRFQKRRSMWNRLMNGENGLEIVLEVKPYARLQTFFAGAHILIRTYGNSNSHLRYQLETQGPELLVSLCSYLQAGRERRQQIRVPVAHTFHVFPILEDESIGAALEAEMKDISLNGISFSLAQQLPTSRAYVQLEQPSDQEAFVLLVHIVRSHRRGDNRYEIGATLAENAPQNSSATASSKNGDLTPARK